MEGRIIDVDDENSLKRARRRAPERFDPDPKAEEEPQRPPQPKKRHQSEDEGEGDGDGKISPRRRSTRLRTARIIKVENAVDGSVRCPRCGSGILLSHRGCNIATCRNHRPQFLFFCCHCGEECPGGVARCPCPRRNDRDARLASQRMRNDRSSRHPVSLLDEEEEEEEEEVGKGYSSQNHEEVSPKHPDDKLAAASDNPSIETDTVEVGGNTEGTDYASVEQPDQKIAATSTKIRLSADSQRHPGDNTRGPDFTSVEQPDQKRAATSENRQSTDSQQDTNAATRRAPRRTAAPTTFRFDDDEDAESEEEKENEVDEDYEAESTTAGGKKARTKKARSAGPRKKVDADAEAAALAKIRAWMGDYESESSPYWDDPDNEFRYYSSRGGEEIGGAPHTKHSAVELVELLRGQLCQVCTESLASNFDRRDWACYGCSRKGGRYGGGGPMRFESLAPSQAAHIYRFGQEGRRMLDAQSRPSVAGKRTGMWKVVDLYEPSDCLRVAEKVHGGFFSVHLAIAKYRKRKGAKWPDKSRY